MRFAINPLQWYQRPDGTLDFDAKPDLPGLLGEIFSAGFTAMHAEPWDGYGVERYLAAFEAAGVTPAPGYFECDTTADRADLVDRAKAEAHRHLALGLDRIFLAAAMVPERWRLPAIGAPTAQPLDERIEALAAIGSVFLEAGVQACFHQHVGTGIETEAELRALLDEAPSLAFGPDIGHLTWAGADPVALVADYRERVGALHLKDVHVDARDAAARDGLDYPGATLRGIWAELGDGDVDIAGALELVAGPSDRWAVVEVDFTQMPTPVASARRCSAWLDSWRNHE